ncbi:MAG: hypothetical protein ACRDL5_17125 [Solirubrobacteraceae bacterium]
MVVGALALAGSVGAARTPAAGVPAGSPSLPGAPHCPVFGPDSPWNQRVDQLPVARDSAALIARIGLDAPVHPDFGTVWDGAPNGIPYTIVSDRTRLVPVSFRYASESDGHRYPLPAGVAIEGGPRSQGDRHVIVVNRDTCTDYELFAAYPHDHGRRWTAGSGAIFNLRSDRLRPAGWTSADAAGLPILPGLALYQQVAGGAIDHALRFTAPCTGNRYVYPARHDAPSCPPCARRPASSGRTAHESSGCENPGRRPPMGLRVRLKASVPISGLPYQARVVAQALKRYGMILADNGSPWYISGAPNARWNNSALHELGRLTGRDFQVVNTNSLPRPGL